MNDPLVSRRLLVSALATAPILSTAASAAEAAAFAAADPKAPLTKIPQELVRGAVAPVSGPDRGAQGLFPRIGGLNAESYQDYLGSRRLFLAKLTVAGQLRGESILQAHGIDPKKPTDMPVSEIIALLKDDPLIARAARFGYDTHYDAFSRLRDHYHEHGSFYEDKLAAAERKGPGVLELNPRLNTPDYAKHEIHNQVGGYTGDPFAGPIYYYGTLCLNDGANKQDAMFDTIAQYMPLPADGRVRRILDNGTGPGQLATSLKRRFPDAEVWGVDVSGPMVRYAHQRANEIGVNVNFAQRLAEDNGFPDNYFDIIASSTFHHEVTSDASVKIFKEAQRSLRPGGLFRPAESGINGYNETPQGKVGNYLSYRVNHEVWVMEWAQLDRIGAMRSAGLKVDPHGAPGSDGRGGAFWLRDLSLVAVKI